MPDFTIEWHGPIPNQWAGRDGESPVAICDHIMQGTMGGTDSCFHNPTWQASAHFGVARDGRIWQWVNETDTAWANGILESPDMSLTWLNDAVVRGVNPNKVTVSIEHEGDTGQPLTDVQYQATLWLHDYLCTRFKIPRDRQHIVGHYQITAQSRANCPGSAFPFDQLLKDLGAKRVTDNVTTTWPTPPYQGDPNRWVPVETGFEVNNVFGLLTYWQTNGGLPEFGFPISGAAFLPGSNSIIAQYFERARLEFHQDDNKIYRGRVGAELLDALKQLANASASSGQIAQLQQQIQLLTSQRDDALNNVAARDSAIKEMQGRIDGQKTLLAQKDALIAQLQGQIAQLQQEIRDLQNPPGGGGGGGGQSTPSNPFGFQIKNPPAPGSLTFGSYVRANAAQQMWRPVTAASLRTGALAVGGDSGSGSSQFRAGAVMVAVFNPPDYGRSTPNPTVVDVNDSSTNVTTLRLAYSANSDFLYAVWRQVPADNSEGWGGYFRVLDGKTGAPAAAGQRLKNFCNSGFTLDQPDIAVSPLTGKLYIVGQLQKSPPALAIAESTDNGQSWNNLQILRDNRPNPANGVADIGPRISCDWLGNIHLVYLWDSCVWANTYIASTGSWTSPALLADSNNGYIYRYLGGVASFNDGFAYACGDSQNSIWLGAFDPQRGTWETVSTDALQGRTNPKYSYPAVTSDGRLFIALGYDDGQSSGQGLEVVCFTDHGATISSSLLAVPHERDSEIVSMQYVPYNGDLLALATFKNPRETLFASTL